MLEVDFEDLLKTAGERELRLLIKKGSEYRCGDEDVLANFKRIAKLINLPVSKVWAVYFIKHVDSILNHIRSDVSSSKMEESLESRIDDARNYLALGRAIFQEQEK